MFFYPYLTSTFNFVVSCSSVKVAEEERVKRLLSGLKTGIAHGPGGSSKLNLCLAIMEISSVLIIIF